MDTVGLLVGVSSVAVGLITVLICLPLLRGQIPRNNLYGFRLAEAFQSDEAWTQINRYGARRMISWAIPLILLGVATCFLPLSQQPWLTGGLALMPVVFVLAPAYETWKYARVTRR